MDPRESASSTGNPRSDAVYRTNHGYDPYTVEHYMWNNTGAYTNSLQRYELFPELFDEYVYVWSGVLGSPDLLLSYSMIALALHDTIILIITNLAD